MNMPMMARDIMLLSSPISPSHPWSHDPWLPFNVGTLVNNVAFLSAFVLYCWVEERHGKLAL